MSGWCEAERDPAGCNDDSGEAGRLLSDFASGTKTYGMGQGGTAPVGRGERSDARCGGESSNTPFGLQALDAAYRKCRQGKRQARNTQAYEAAYLDRLVSTAEAIAAGRWRPSRTLSFVVSQPKWREINAADFGDRVVHTLLAERLERLYEPIFIHDSYANRLGKGTHAAVDRLQAFLRRVEAAAGRHTAPRAHYLQLDIANFFNSIHRPTLFRLLQKRLAKSVRAGLLPRDEARTLQTLCRAILAADPLANVQQRGPARLFARVPPHKRLGALGPGVGLPVGNLTSQFFANVYLNELDQFIKHGLKARWYVRYVDDFVLVHPDPARLADWHRQIVEFLATCLHLKLRPGSHLRPLSDGIDFLGYIVRPHYRLVRRRVVNRCRQVLAEFERGHIHAHGWHLPPAARDTLRARLASYLGHFSHAAHRRLWQGMQRRHPWLHELFTCTEDEAADAITLRPRWRPAAPTRLADEWRFFAASLPGYLLLIKVGSQYLAAGLDARWLVQHRLARPVALRPGLPELAALPRPGLAACRARLKRLGVAHAVVVEEELRRDGRRARSVAVIWSPDNGADDDRVGEGERSDARRGGGDGAGGGDEQMRLSDFSAGTKTYQNRPHPNQPTVSSLSFFSSPTGSTQ